MSVCRTLPLCVFFFVVNGCGGDASSPEPILAVDAGPSQDANGGEATDPCSVKGAISDLLAEEDAPHSFHIVDDVAYWTSSDLSQAPSPVSIKRMALSGESPKTLYSTTKQVAAIAPYNDYLYWVEVADAGIGNGTVMRVIATGGSAESLYTVNNLDSFAIAVNDEAIYWLTHAAINAGYEETVWRGSLDGSGAAENVATVELPLTENVQRLQLVDDTLYWSLPTGYLLRVKTAGGPIEQVLQTDQGIRGFALDDTYAYYADSVDNGSIYRVPLSGNNTPELVVDAAAAARSMLVHNGQLLYSNFDDEIRAISVTDPLPETSSLVSDKYGTSATRLIARGKTLYWATTASRSSGGGIHAICLP